jgi:hypothetical protein
MIELTQGYLKKCIYYNEHDGLAVWKRRPVDHFKSERDAKIWNTKNAGNCISCKGNNGYFRLSINGKSYSLHRLVFLYMDGSMPANQVDHKDKNRLNNKYDNLRQATALINSQNQPLRSNNTSGIKGVYWNSLRKKWHARITVNKKVIHLGYYTKKKEAEIIRKK